MLATATKSESKRAIDCSKSFSDNRKWRDELHGIRGIAILLVVTFHIFGNGRVSGGIDIFLAITGFLAIPSLYRRAIAGGGFIPLTSRFGGLARRLLIPLVPVLIFIAVVGSFVLPQAFQPQMFIELRASALFAENIELVRSQLTYDAAGPATSALQHLWSTSIQVQFHILMPFVFMLLTVPLVKHGRNPRQALMVFLSLITVASFLYAWWNQGVNQPANYFSSISRLWELTLPGILGLTISKFKFNAATRAFMTWIGLLMLLSTGFFFDGASVFPGPQALLPVGGLLLFLTGGKSYTRWGADNLVKIPQIKFLADISYSLYLWHWPVLIFYLNYFAKQKLGALDALAVFTVSIALGTMGKKLFEDRVASLNVLKNNNIAVLLAIVIMLTTAGTFHWKAQTSQTELDHRKSSFHNASYTVTQFPGAMALTSGIDASPTTPLPDTDIALVEIPDVYHFAPGNSDEWSTCVPSASSERTFPTTCEFGSDTAERTVVLTGGSHIGQWWPAFEGMASDYDWDLILVERSECQLGLDQDIHEPDLNISGYCMRWNDEAVSYIRDEIRPDLVITLGTTMQFGQPEAVNASQQAAWEQLEGIPLLLLRDNPVLYEKPTECLQQRADIKNPETYTQCTLNRDDYGYSNKFDDAHHAEHPTNSYYVNTAAILTVDDTIPPVIGNVLVWRDSNHVTSLYSRSAREFFERALSEFQPGLLR
ncbi:acyltransferase family protein [Actinomyces sp. HMSC065F11]|uniref:acyltransferase family protein n=1 Tax=Actinomyces sp. HMSC065F11 TaxID=1739395 RepID=UPI001C9A126C|nr:acyltransferase family protein [Actinomyces sp. HMSC065F11]